ncbi:hypothetical protein BB559_000869 [Furculomyces boomerangus]|uniref:Uncharacterized protein n=1 Tax=Furculomyces boomerangus TaxID=61424 RepID=A0A2T9Z3S4_9FUNG|nr:hypothetical protein BB559_000869 [Furculomyces boomerangus]
MEKENKPSGSFLPSLNINTNQQHQREAQRVLMQGANQAKEAIQQNVNEVQRALMKGENNAQGAQNKNKN